MPFFPLDVVFEEDASVMPLMSAAKVWSNLENTTEDESLFKNITILLIVQVITFNLKKKKGECHQFKK